MSAEAADDSIGHPAILPEHFERGKREAIQNLIFAVDSRRKMYYALRIMLACTDPATDETVERSFRAAFAVFLGMAFI